MADHNAMTYQRLASAISDAGFYTTGDFVGSVICASKLHANGYTGNSFWIAARATGWFLGTWGPHLYRIPDPQRISELCIAWLKRHPDSTPSDIDSYIREEFRLIEIAPNDLPDE